jgi:hypothetical protein
MSTIGYTFREMQRGAETMMDRLMRDYLNDHRLDLLLGNNGLTWESEPPRAALAEVPGRHTFDIPYEMRRISPQAASEIITVQHPHVRTLPDPGGSSSGPPTR